jgi:hypothetical protein
MSISRIGIFENTALIIAVRSSGFLNASSDLFIYKKVNGEWKLDKLFGLLYLIDVHN